ncbi:unnamed protein product [Amoebophrya sp. A120]|nr:unnamed protein product [Amoebophrya sp. A120]|eukprot:GSA120T00023551001.1
MCVVIPSPPSPPPDNERRVIADMLFRNLFSTISPLLV